MYETKGYKLVKRGLDQLPTKFLENLKAHIEGGGKLLLDGRIYSVERNLQWPMLAAVPVGAMKDKYIKCVTTALKKGIVSYMTLEQLYGAGFQESLDSNPEDEDEFLYENALMEMEEEDIKRIVKELLLTRSN